jgi:hypothetical protein
MRTIDETIRAIHGPATDTICWLRRRDRSLNLELESSHPLGYVVPYIEEAFDSPLYIATIRHPVQWIRSRINFHYSTSPSIWKKFREAFWKPEPRSCHTASVALSEHLGVHTLETYLTAYSNRYTILRRYVPCSRCMFVDTSSINKKTGNIAQFLGLDPRTVSPVHSNAYPYAVDVSEHVPDSALLKIIRSTCSSFILDRYDI